MAGPVRDVDDCPAFWTTKPETPSFADGFAGRLPLLCMACSVRGIPRQHISPSPPLLHTLPTVTIFTHISCCGEQERLVRWRIWKVEGAGRAAPIAANV